MPLFNCKNCGVIENTALGYYWMRNSKPIEEVFDKEELTKLKPECQTGLGIALCSECTPTKYANGTGTGEGVWHNKFDKSYDKAPEF